VDDVVQVPGATSEPVQLRDHDGIAGQKRLHQLGELGPPVCGLARRLLATDALATGRLERLDLGGIVLCARTDPRVPIPQGRCSLLKA
jgi:hypothetical protein